MGISLIGHSTSFFFELGPVYNLKFSGLSVVLVYDLGNSFPYCFFLCLVVQLLSRVWLFLTPLHCSSPGFPVLHYLPEFVQTHAHWVGDTIQPSCSVLPASPPALNLSHHQGLFIRWPKYWSFNISLCNEYSGLISFKIYWFDLLVVQGTLKSLVQHHKLKASILCCSAFFMV